MLKSVYALLSQLRVPVLRIYSGMQQKQRIQHLNRFRSLADALLLATDVAARGLDLPAVHTVLHFHLPPTPVIFVHRCGRTARGGTRGLAIAMVAAGEKKIYREICEFCGRANGFAGFPVGAAVSPAVIRCVGIAREIAKEVAAATKIDRDADWLRKSAEEADLEDYFDTEGLTSITDMYAENSEMMSTVNVMYTKMELAERLSYLTMDEEAVIDTVLSQSDYLVSLYESMGATVISMEKVQVNFLGEEHYAVKTVTDSQGITTYTLQFSDPFKGAYSITTTIISYGEDNTQAVADLFFPVEE